MAGGDPVDSLPGSCKLAGFPVQASMHCISNFGKLLNLGCDTTSSADAGVPTLQQLTRNTEFQSIDIDFLVHGGQQVHFRLSYFSLGLPRMTL